MNFICKIVELISTSSNSQDSRRYRNLQLELELLLHSVFYLDKDELVELRQKQSMHRKLWRWMAEAVQGTPSNSALYPGYLLPAWNNGIS